MDSQTPDQLHLPQPPGGPDPGPGAAATGHEPPRENWLKLIGLLLLHDAVLLLMLAVAVFVGVGVLAAVFESAPVVAFIDSVESFMGYFQWTQDE